MSHEPLLTSERTVDLMYIFGQYSAFLTVILSMTVTVDLMYIFGQYSAFLTVRLSKTVTVLYSYLRESVLLTL